MPTLLPPPPDLSWDLSYRLSPRAKRAFKTPLDAAKLLDAKGMGSVTLSTEGGVVRLTQSNPLKGGTIAEVLELDVTAGRMKAATFERVVKDASGTEVRREQVDFRAGTIPLPDDVYPEVMTPFLLAHQPWTGATETLYTWINDRFIARVHAEAKRGTVEVAGRKRDAIAIQMYPDFNDWVPLGKMLSKLTKPFLPRYYIWLDPSSRKVLRFEGPYGPPGAPEIVLELAD